MIKLQASYGLKVPAEEQYSSKSFHASIELELADGSEPAHIKGVLQRVWSDLKAAVNAEINPPRAQAQAALPNYGIEERQPLPSGRSIPSGRSFSNNNGSRGGQNGSQPAEATKKQIGFLLGTARHNRNRSASALRATQPKMSAFLLHRAGHSRAQLHLIQTV